jgi:hypothetical protein
VHSPFWFGNDKVTNHVPFVLTPYDNLDLCKIPCIFGLEVCVLVGGFSFQFFCMEVSC